MGAIYSKRGTVSSHRAAINRALIQARSLVSKARDVFIQRCSNTGAAVRTEDVLSAPEELKKSCVDAVEITVSSPHRLDEPSPNPIVTSPEHSNVMSENSGRTRTDESSSVVDKDRFEVSQTRILSTF